MQMTRSSSRVAIGDDAAELAGLSRESLAKRWRTRFGHEPPRGCGRTFLELAEAYALQTAAFGFLKPGLRRQIEGETQSSGKRRAARMSKNVSHLTGNPPGAGMERQDLPCRCQRGRLCLEWKNLAVALGLQFNGSDFPTEHHHHAVAFSLRRRGVEAKLVLGAAEARAIFVDSVLVDAIAQGHNWVKQLSTGLAKSAAEIAAGAGIDDGEVTRVLPLAFLAPDIVEAILTGRQPVTLTARYLKRLKPIPITWAEQRRVLGFGSANPH